MSLNGSSVSTIRTSVTTGTKTDGVSKPLSWSLLDTAMVVGSRVSSLFWDQDPGRSLGETVSLVRRETSRDSLSLVIVLPWVTVCEMREYFVVTRDPMSLPSFLERSPVCRRPTL